MKINIKNTGALEEAMKVGQFKERARLLDVKIVTSVCKQALARLSNMGMYRAEMAGAKLRYMNGYGRFPASYTGRPEATHFDFEIIRGEIFITNIYRDGCEFKERIEFLNQEQFRDAFAKRALNLMAA